MQEPTIFTRIIRGEVPSHKIYEDDMTLAFMNIHPVVTGHVLVIPKREVEFVWDLEPTEYQALMATVQKVGLRLRDIINTPYVGQMVVGTDVPHAHIHVVPFTHAYELKRTIDPNNDEPDYTALAILAEKLRF